MYSGIANSFLLLLSLLVEADKACGPEGSAFPCDEMIYPWYSCGTFSSDDGDDYTDYILPSNKGRFFKGITSVSRCKNPLHWLARGGPRLVAKEREVKTELSDPHKDTFCETCLRRDPDSNKTGGCENEGRSVIRNGVLGLCTWTCLFKTDWYFTVKVPTFRRYNTSDYRCTENCPSENWTDTKWDVERDRFLKKEYRTPLFSEDLNRMFRDGCATRIDDYQSFQKFLDYQVFCPECDRYIECPGKTATCVKCPDCEDGRQDLLQKGCQDPASKWKPTCEVQYTKCIFDVCMMRKTDTCSDLLSQQTEYDDAEYETIMNECNQYDMTKA